MGSENGPTAPRAPVLDYRAGAADGGENPLYAVAIPVAVLMTVLLLSASITVIPADRLPLATVPIIRSPAKEVLRLLPLVVGGGLGVAAWFLKGNARNQSYVTGIWVGLLISLLAVGTLVVGVMGFIGIGGGR